MLAACINLTFLDLSQCNLTDTGLERLVTLTALQTLLLKDCVALTSFRIGLASPNSLQTLNLAGCPKLVGLSGLESTTSLTHLYLSGCAVTTEELRSL